jgi:PAS domain S-box-containing protein
MQVAGLPISLIWAFAVLAFGMLLMVCVVLLLRREGQSPEWDLDSAPGGARNRQLQHMSRLLRAVRSVNNLIVAERDERQLLEKACRLLVTTRGYRMAWIGLVGDGDKRVRPVTQAGFEEGYLDQIEITWDDSPMGQGPTGRAIKLAEPSLMRDIETDPTFRPWREQALRRGYRSSAALPLRFRGQVLGALNVYSEMPDAFDIEEVGLLQEMADHLAHALGTFRLESELEQARRAGRLAAAFRTAFENASVGMVVTGSDGIIQNVNDCMMELLNTYESREQIVGRLSLAKLRMFRGSAVRANVAELFSERHEVEFECRTSAADGRERLLRCRGVPIMQEGEGLTEAVWLVEDVTGHLTRAHADGGRPH